MCLAPARNVNVDETEIAKIYKAVGTTVEPISFVVPRKVRLPLFSRFLLCI